MIGLSDIKQKESEMTQRNPNPFQPSSDPTLEEYGRATNIEVKGIKLNKHFSQETHCFRATVYIDGKRAFSAENEGCGGPNNYYPYGKTQKAGAKRDAQLSDFKNAMSEARKEAARYIEAKGEDYDWAIDRFADNDELIDWLIADLINESEMLKHMRHVLKRRVVAYDQRTREICTWKLTPIEKNIDPVKKYHEITANKNEWVWLNEVPEHEALKHWRNAK